MHGAPVKAAKSSAPFDGEALRRDLAALARANARQPSRHRSAALTAIRAPFTEARDSIRSHVEASVMPGLAAALSLGAAG